MREAYFWRLVALLLRCPGWVRGNNKQSLDYSEQRLQ